MGRTGFDQKKHPSQLQLSICEGVDIQGIQNSSSVTIDFKEGKITSYHTNDDQSNTAIREYRATDIELKELYDFFTVDAIKSIEAMSESEIRQYEIGYYDCALLRYFLISGDGQLSDGERNRVYSIDPIEMAIKWMQRILPFNLDS